HERIRRHARQRAADLGLEQHDHRERQVEEDLARDGLQRRQVERARHKERAGQDDQPDRYLHGARAADQREDVVNDEGDDEDVDGVAPRELELEKTIEDVHLLRSSIATSTFRKSTVSRTSCTRTIAAPARYAAATAASEPTARSGPAGRPVRCPMND